MPEGHLIHRYAAEHGEQLAGGPLSVSSPQGQFADGASALHGAALRGADAYGKHLFYSFVERPTLHVHLGMAGRFVVSASESGAVIPAARIRLEGDRSVVQLIAPARCELRSDEQVADMLAALGPDPLRDDADPARALSIIGRSNAPIGALLLDQSVIAGIGNVLRAEILYELGIHPARSGSSLSVDQLQALWRTTVEMMRRARARGRIITRIPDGVDEDHVASLDENEGRFVYRRDDCGRCGERVESWTLAGRTAYACPRCQAA